MNSDEVSPHWLSPARVRRRFNRASATYDAAAGVVDDLRLRLLERLDLVRLSPRVVLDLGAGTGAGTRALKDRYRSAQVIAVDSAFAMTQAARRRRGWLRPFDVLCADAGRLPLAARSVDLVFSHLMLPWCNEPDPVFAECARVLRPGGLLMFTGLGPDTARELAQAVDPRGAVRIHAHMDMHDVGDALLRARFADPVMDVETIRVTYDNFEKLLLELRHTGSTNVAAGSIRGLGNRRWLAQLSAGYEALRSEGKLPLTLEVVYGHAWCVDHPARVRGGEVAVPVSRIGRR